MPRELSKCREWEKDRRERLKKGFASLSKVLPCYEPSITLSKIEILQKAQAYIEELQIQIKELLDGKSTKPECSTIKKLHDRVRKLVIRNEQLCNLLIDAGIKLPSECGNVKKFKGTKIWSNRITPEQAKKLLKKEKENDQKKPKKKLQNKNRKARIRQPKKIPRRDVINTQTITTNLLQSSNFITLVTTQSCFIITNAPSTNINQNCLTKTTTVLTNSNLFSTPLVASTVKPPLVITKGNGAINTVSSGTLLVANGSLLPVIQQSALVPTQTIITNPAPIVVKPAASNNTTLFVVPTSDIKDASTNSKQTPSSTQIVKTTINSKITNVSKSLPLLKPKRSDLTKTTHVNKVPIPALTSKYANDLISQVTSLQNIKSKVKSNRNTKKEVIAKCKKPEKVEEKVKIDETQAIKETDVSNITESSTSKSEKNNENTEPTVKKLKLTTEICSVDSNDENKKVNIISAYTIDSLCNESGDPSSTVTQQSTDKLNCAKETEVSKLCEEANSTNRKDQEGEKGNETAITIPQVQTKSTKEEDHKVEEVLNEAIDTNIQKDKTEAMDNNNKLSENQKTLELNNALMHSDLSNDIFASLSHVSTGGGQNPESTSPTAAFLLAFPLVSSLNSLKVTEVIEDEVTESQRGTPTLLQIGTMDTTKPTQSQSDTLTPSLLNLDNFSFFSREFYAPFDPIVTSSSSTTSSITTTTTTKTCESKKDVVDFHVTLPEKKSVSEAQPKDDLKYTLKSIYNKESPIYRNDNKDIVSQSSSTSRPNASVTKICENIAPVTKSISTVSISQSIPSETVYRKGSIISICRSSNVVGENIPLTSTCQNTSATPFYQNSTITTQSTSVVPSTSISICQNTSTTPQYQNSTSATQGTPITSHSSASVCQNSFISSFCQTSGANQRGSLIAPPTVSLCQNTSITPFYENSTTTNQNTSLLPSSLLPVSQSGISPLYQNSAVVSRSNLFVPPLAAAGKNISTGTRYQDTVAVSQSTPLVPVCQSGLSASVCHSSTAVSYSASLSSISHNSTAITLCQNTSTASLYYKTPISSVCQNSVISNLNATSTSVSENISLRPTTTVVSQNSSILPISQNVPTISVCQNITSLPNANFNTLMNSTSDYTLPYNHPFYSNTQTVATTSSTVINNTKHQVDKSKTEKKSCNYYPTTTSYSVPQYNTFNPFTDIPKSTTYPISTKTYNDALYTSNTTYSYNYHPDNFTSYSTTKNNIKPDKLYCGLNYDNYDYKHNEFQKYDTRNQQVGYYYSQSHIPNKDKTSSEPSNKNHNVSANNNKATVNWMTTPDVRQHIQNDFIMPSLGKEVDFAPNPIYSTNSFSGTQTTYFNTNTSLYTSNDLHNTTTFPAIPPNSFQRNELEENQFSWSPSKLPQLLDTTHNFVSGTLPTLVGDLALGNTQPFIDQKIESKNMKDFRVKDNSRRSKSSTNYDSQSNFLSVSQLVDHNKNDAIPGRVGNRRNSGNRSSNKNSSSSKSVKRKTEKEVHNFNKVVEKQIKHNNNHEYQSQGNENSNWMPANKSRNIKIPSSSYSAEALIGHQNQTDVNRTRNTQNYSMVNKALPVPFLTDNIIPYFPMDIPQDNTLVQQNQNYQSNTFTHNFPSTIQGSVYSNSTFVPNPTPITTSYLSSTNFIPDIGGNSDYVPILSENTFTHVKDKISKNKSVPIEKPNDKRNMTQSNNNCSVNSLSTSKKSKKKQHNEPPNLSNLDFSFLSMPAAINSPILPDDFQAHTSFLPPPTPTQLYPCKNPLYGKQDLPANSLLTLPTASRSGVAHPEISPSLNNVGTTLTNFNLSTIFPEINKGSASMSIYPENGKTKDYNPREFLPGTSQVRFKANLSYINSSTSAS
ncbi:hypothetical protein Trydic_g4830 [Trypoxylus dichotomus]